MIKLQSSTFRNAYRKAADVQPLVKQISEQEYDVRRKDGNFTRVVFMLHNDCLWAQCGCPAGNPPKYSRAPVACYHVAACLLATSPATAPAPIPAPEPEAQPHARTHTHHCVRCHDSFRCGANFCAGVEDSICDDCDQAEADKLGWEVML